ncbi:MAG: hypothetical protein ACTSQY_02700 [Candidatus Odinarchaeia archaeon]
MPAYEDILKNFEARQQEAREANLRREAQVEAIFDEMIARYGPGGTFGRSYESELAKRKIRDVSAATQADISRGLYGVVPRATEWESTVGAPARLKLEDIKMQRLSQAQTQKAGFLERIEDTYPDYALIAGLAQQIGRGAGGATVRPSGTVGGIGGSPFSSGYAQHGWWDQPLDTTTGGSSAPLNIPTYTKAASTPSVAPTPVAPIAPPPPPPDASSFTKMVWENAHGAQWRAEHGLEEGLKQSAELATKYTKQRGYKSPSQVKSPWGLPAPYTPYTEMIAKYGGPGF